MNMNPSSASSLTLHTKLSRRQALKQGMAGTLALALTPGALGNPTGPQQRSPRLHDYNDYAWLRGFNIIPFWANRIDQAWWEYHPDRFRAEIDLARQVHGNCIRLWIEYSAWRAYPDKVTGFFHDAIQAIDEAGMKTMPCLFNRRHHSSWDYGGTYDWDLTRNWGERLQYIVALVKPLANDPRILLWDLCNEPQAQNVFNGINPIEFAWLKSVSDTVRSCNAQQPITIGTTTGDNIRVFASLCDVLACHPHCPDLGLIDYALDACQEVQNEFRKPMLCNEAVSGAREDLQRAKLALVTTEALVERGWGWMGWSLQEGRAVAARRDRPDENGIDGHGFHAWFNSDRTLRAGLDFLLERPNLQPPWMA